MRFSLCLLFCLVPVLGIAKPPIPVWVEDGTSRYRHPNSELPSTLGMITPRRGYDELVFGPSRTEREIPKYIYALIERVRTAKRNTRFLAPRPLGGYSAAHLAPLADDHPANAKLLVTASRVQLRVCFVLPYWDGSREKIVRRRVWITLKDESDLRYFDSRKLETRRPVILYLGSRAITTVGIASIRIFPNINNGNVNVTPTYPIENPGRGRPYPRLYEVPLSSLVFGVPSRTLETFRTKPTEGMTYTVVSYESLRDEDVPLMDYRDTRNGLVGAIFKHAGQGAPLSEVLNTARDKELCMLQVMYKLANLED